MNDHHQKLYEYSKHIILSNQHVSGAYVASPNFPTYHYCWFRDGAYIAYAMNLAGEHDSARRFHAWSSQRIIENRDSIIRGIKRAKAGLHLDAKSILNTRYHLDGKPESDGSWPNFQLDGFGTWLWSLNEHKKIVKEPLPNKWMEAAGLTADYLSILWQLPCYDCWEEFPNNIHPSSLAAIYGGLNAYNEIGGKITPNLLSTLKDRINEYAVLHGYFTKFLNDPSVDANLISLALPYAVFSVNDKAVQETVSQIEKTLGIFGGIHRYAKDTYYGGGEWLILTSWLGWYKVQLSRIPNVGNANLLRIQAEKYLDWCIDHSTIRSNEVWLPEQVSEHMNSPEYLIQWEKKWGHSANPLLWSHAMYIILYTNLLQV